jgi:hypothetical protein
MNFSAGDSEKKQENFLVPFMQTPRWKKEPEMKRKQIEYGERRKMYKSCEPWENSFSIAFSSFPPAERFFLSHKIIFTHMATSS